jgi:hypothetical protein
MSENRVERIFGPKREEVAGGWRRLHNELHNLWPSQNVITVIKWTMRWKGHVARMGELRNKTVLQSEKIMGGDHTEDLSVDGKIIQQ